jgi:putative DNA primase/helicase
MDFLSFCRAHGILIDAMPRPGVWARYRTTDHPRKRNGAVKWLGHIGFVQNHAVDQGVAVWKSDGQTDETEFRRLVQDSERKRLLAQKAAADKALHILRESSISSHPYLERKGLDPFGMVYRTNDKRLLVISMRVGPNVVGCQLIDEDGNKKFLFGQRTSEAVHVLDGKGPAILCEGYATGRSIQAAMMKLKLPFRVVIGFSAGNVAKLAAIEKPGLIVADNDASGTGQRMAAATGWPYWISEIEGEDANDAHQRMGLFKFSQSLLNAWQRAKRLDGNRLTV